jgi:competence protein ComEC
MRSLNFAIVSFSIFLTLGVLIASAKTISFKFAVYGLVYCWFLFILFWSIARKQLVQNNYFGIMTYLVFFFIGVVHYQLNIPQYTNKHFSHFHESDNYSLIDLKVAKLLNLNSYYNNYIVEVVWLGNSSVTGKALLQIRKDTTHLLEHNIDDRLLVSAQIFNMKPALNPNQFNYSKYMQTRGVYHQIKILPRDILQYKKGRNTLRGSAERIRGNIINEVSLKSKGENEFSIFKALVLGDRINIDQELYAQYIDAGAVHILAVSGLHVGLIYLLLLFVLNPIKRIPYGSLLLPLFTIISLWAYAFITGLSESVIRSVTMFSLFALAKLLQRRTNSINILFLSYFILVLISPVRLFRIGFQLSYLAVFFILWIQPMIYTLYRPRFYLDKLFWGIISVSIAAQLGILPLSLFYFHRFPGMFLITNSVVLPLLGLLLGGGFMLIILTLLKVLPEIVSDGYWLMIELMNSFIEWVSANDSFIIENIHFSLEKMLMSYILMITAILLWKVPNYRNLLSCLITLILIIGIFTFNRLENSRNEFVIFHKRGQTNIGIIQPGIFYLYMSDLDSSSSFDHTIRPYMISKDIQNYTKLDLPELFLYDRNLVCVLDKKGTYPKDKKLDWIILTSNPKVNLERLIYEVEPRMIIADGNNWKFLVERWKNTCIRYDIPIYNTAKSGAFIYQK